MKKNMGNADRIVRIVVGLIALGAGFYLGMNYWVMGIGAVILVTGLMNSCPIYSMLGMSTASKEGSSNPEAPKAPEVPEVPSVPQTEEPKEEEATAEEEPKEEAMTEEPKEEEAPAEEEPKEEDDKVNDEVRQGESPSGERVSPGGEGDLGQEKKEM